MENIEENNNLLIAEFMGVDITPVGLRRNVMQKSYFESELKYNTSYDWLIPVMQQIYMTATAMPEEYYKVTHAYAIATIDDMYLTTVQFIKWYNNWQK